MRLREKEASLVASLAILLLLSLLSTGGRGYLAPGSSTGGIHDLVLIYVHPGEKWSPEDFLPYVAYVGRDGSVKDSFFDGFLILTQLAPSGGVFMEAILGMRPSTPDDWDWLLWRYFGQGQVLSNLSASLELASVGLGRNLSAGVVLMIPYPDPTAGRFELDGLHLDFGRDEDRLRAVRWFVDRCLLLWNSSGYGNLRLVGFYWMRETVPGSDVWLVKAVNEYLHRRGLLSFWIPFYFAQGVSSWRELGFDAVALQPNYFFYFWAEEDRVKKAAERARKLGTSVEMEVDDNVILNKEAYYPRYRKYLEEAVREGFARGFVAYYQAVRTLWKLCYSDDPELRGLYDATYEVAKLG